MSASSVTLGFGPSLDTPGKYNSTVIIGKPDSIKDILPKLLEPIGLKSLDSQIFDAMIDEINTKKGGESATMIKLEDDSATHKIILGALPSQVSRNNHPMSVHSLTKLAGSAKGNSRVLILTDDFPVGPLASSIAKAFPLFSMKSNNGAERSVDVAFCKSDGTFVDDNEQLKAAQSVAAGVQLAARLVDSHPELMTTTQFAKEVEKLASENPKASFKQLVGDELMPYGGLHAVGKAAVCPPRLVLLEYDGGGDETVALVGKGILYDTGGLSLKPKTGKN
jgi:leucyl aminopeptidase